MIIAFVNPLGTLLSPLEDGAPDFSAGLGQLLQQAELVPVTGMDEVELLMVPASFTSWQILRHGAVVLTPDGAEDPAWRRLTLETQAEIADALTLAHQAAVHIGQLGQLDTEAELLTHGAYPLLLKVTHPHQLPLATDQLFQELQAWLEESPFRSKLRITQLGTEVLVLPRDITPESAVNYVLSRWEGTITLTVGVSVYPTDLPFMSQCDLALTPGAPLAELQEREQEPQDD
ncbi:hypothetical protein DEDE109153_12025 [Deinococcus deserti]|uniref:Uncharacterized protein n=1 Tax=Deinococcus deserti (strain DSM 17065 / CIP 109153 / LMG 22923 / VCD115) TaxID=546414 RepID=C1D2L7_DEIDV|nr:hypothetical protein [Deinococcus deserti]ACO47656.1 hypothetical protein Deide_2p00020 [Deinococcus deserti VCD115]